MAATKTKKKPAKKKPTTKVKAKAKVKAIKARPLLDDKELKAEELDLRKEYPHIIRGTLRNIGGDPKKIKAWRVKRTVEIKCTMSKCKTIRRIATSDLHQCKMCPDCTIDERLRRRREARAAVAEKPK